MSDLKCGEVPTSIQQWESEHDSQFEDLRRQFEQQQREWQKRQRRMDAMEQLMSDLKCGEVPTSIQQWESEHDSQFEDLRRQFEQQQREWQQRQRRMDAMEQLMNDLKCREVPTSIERPP